MYKAIYDKEHDIRDNVQETYHNLELLGRFVY